MTIFPVDVDAIIVIGTALIIGFLVGLVGLIIGRIVSPSREYPLKRERFEAGNPPKGRARGWFAMQYYPYLIVFLTIEPIIVYSYLFLMVAHNLIVEAATIFGLIILMIIPPLIFGLDSARRVREWLIAGEE